MRAIATAPAARGLADDAAVLEIGGARLVVTHDAIVEGIHYRSDDPPGSVAWKLVAVNLSDLAAKGARPIGALLGYTLADSGWDAAFVEGLGRACDALGVPLIGGDTVAGRGWRTLSLTAIGAADGPVPSRADAAAGDDLWVTGTIGDAGAGLAVLEGGLQGDDVLVRRYREPTPRLAAGQALAPFVSAMMDVSDGLLIDASRIGGASGLAVTVEIDCVPLSHAFRASLGDGRDPRLRAATSGDDYELLFAAKPMHRALISEVGGRLGLQMTLIGRVESGAGLRLTEAGEPIALPARLGYQHG